MPRVHKPSASAGKSSPRAQSAGRAPRKHPLLLAVVVVTLVLWLGFLGWLAFRG
jgi:hypothetical protein